MKQHLNFLPEKVLIKLTIHNIEDADQARAWFTVLPSSRLGTMHIILAVTDTCRPALTRYKRVILNIEP